MKKFIKQTIATGLLAAGVLGFTVPLPAADKSVDQPAASPAAGKNAKPRGVPFRGKLGAIDKVAKTITVKGKEKDRVFHITSQTKISKAGKPATLEAGVVGEDVSGFARESAGGNREAASVRFGPKPEPEGVKGKAKAEDKKAKD